MLAAAVRHGILTRAQAELIGRNRLEGIPLSQIAAETGISHSALCNRRKRAEKAIADAIAERIPRGLISAARVKKGPETGFLLVRGFPPRGQFRGGRPARRGAAAAADSPPLPPPGRRSGPAPAARAAPAPRTQPWLPQEAPAHEAHRRPPAWLRRVPRPPGGPALLARPGHRVARRWRRTRSAR